MIKQQFEKNALGQFVSKDFDSRYMTEPNTGCWIWLGHITPKGYGLIKIKRQDRLVHRFVYERFKGPIPAGLQIDHLCRMRCCVNPDHLECVTSRVNTLRGFNPPAMNARKTHCKNGHPLVGENVIVRPRDASRECRLCTKERSRRNYLKRKEGFKDPRNRADVAPVL